MDVVLEVADTFFFDWAYALALPAGSRLPSPPASAPAPSQSPPANPAAAVLGYLAGPGPADWSYQPSTHLFAIEPSPYAYMSRWPRDFAPRQFLNLFALTLTFGVILYFTLSTLSYVFIFDKKTLQHPRYLKNQVALEIESALKAMPVMSLLTAPLFLAEVRGHSKMYDAVADGPGLWYSLLQVPLFLFFTDMGVYWIHRWLHHPILYKRIHKPHHKWIMPTPFASYAFHPIDGWSQSLPYHIFPFIFPLQKVVYVMLFVFVTIWTVIIHDGELMVRSPIINGAGSHTLHHLYFNYNYGQYFTLWDRLGGSYRKPEEELFDPTTRHEQATIKKSIKELTEKIVLAEGSDSRTYSEQDKKTI